MILYTQQDFEVETKRLTDGKGVHVIYDGVGKTTFDKDLNVLRPRGYLVLFGASSGAVPPFDLAKLAQKGFLLDHFKRLVGAIQFGRELSTRSVHGGTPQPAIMLVSRGLARTARALRFWILFAQWSSVLLQPTERHFVTLPEGLISTR